MLLLCALSLVLISSQSYNPQWLKNRTQKPWGHRVKSTTQLCFSKQHICLHLPIFHFTENCQWNKPLLSLPSRVQIFPLLKALASCDANPIYKRFSIYPSIPSVSKYLPKLQLLLHHFTCSWHIFSLLVCLFRDADSWTVAKSIRFHLLVLDTGDIFGENPRINRSWTTRRWK